MSRTGTLGTTDYNLSEYIPGTGRRDSSTPPDFSNCVFPPAYCTVRFMATTGLSFPGSGMGGAWVGGVRYHAENRPYEKGVR